jgi:hypothetical protein
MNTLQNENQAPQAAPRIFVKCSGETSRRIMELIGSDNENDTVFPGIHCIDGDHNLIELTGFGKLVTVVKNIDFSDLDVSFYFKLGDDLPRPVFVSMESDFKALILKHAEKQSEPLSAEDIGYFLSPPPAPKFRSEPRPERPHQRGVPPGNVTVRRYSGPKVVVQVCVSQGRH